MWDAAVEVEDGDYDQRVLRGVLNAPIGDSAALRIAAYDLEHDAYYNDVGPSNLGVAEEEDNSGRCCLLPLLRPDWKDRHRCSKHHVPGHTQRFSVQQNHRSAR